MHAHTLKCLLQISGTCGARVHQICFGQQSIVVHVAEEIAHLHAAHDKTLLWDPLQAFALASHACHVHLGTRPGQVLDSLPLPRLKSRDEANLPIQNLIPLPQLEVSTQRWRCLLYHAQTGP